MLGVVPRTKDESCGELERGANGFLTPLGTLHFGGQPCVLGSQGRLKVGEYNYIPSHFQSDRWEGRWGLQREVAQRANSGDGWDAEKGLRAS